MRVFFAHPLWLQFPSSEHVQAYSAYVRTVFTLFCSHAVPQAHSLRQRAIPAWRQGPKYEGVVCPTLMQGQAVRACSQLKPLNCRASWSTSFCSSPVAAIRILKTCTSILHIRTLSCFHCFARLPYPKHTPSTCNPCVSYVDARTRAHTAMLT